MPVHLVLAFAIVSEVVATMALKPAAGFTKPGPSLVVLVGYGLAFFFLSQVLDRLPIGIVYAVWAGGGIVLTALAAWVIFGQRPDAAGFVGIGLIIAGVLVLNLVSKTNVH
ncbi:DMT family transporter [Tropicimonas sp.]|uniref:DMT family transporter n=1 Tax=Tropicimonas sp. TaxID=2067044 RepID=UPI003A89E075